MEEEPTHTETLELQIFYENLEMVAESGANGDTNVERRYPFLPDKLYYVCAIVEDTKYVEYKQWEKNFVQRGCIFMYTKTVEVPQVFYLSAKMLVKLLEFFDSDFCHPRWFFEI